MTRYWITHTFLFFTCSILFAQQNQNSDNFNKGVVAIETMLNELVNANYVLLAEEDYSVIHELDFSLQKDSLIYKVDFFENNEPNIEHFKIGLADIESITVEENPYLDTSVHLLITSKNSKIIQTKKYLDAEEGSVNYINSFYIPVNKGLSEQELQNLQHSFLVLKNELLPYQPKADNSKIKTARIHVKEAVSQNLFVLQPQREEIEKLSKNIKVFVAKCQICLGLQDALKFYLNTAQTENELTILFDSANDEELYIELQQFVAESVSYYLNYPNFNDAEIELIKAALDKERMNSIKNFNILACAACDGAVNPLIEDTLSIEATIQKLQNILNNVNYNTSFESRKNLTAINQQRFSFDEVSYIETIRVDGESNFYERKYFQIPWHTMTDEIVVEHHKPYLSTLNIHFSESLSFIENYQEYKDKDTRDLLNVNEIQLFVWGEDAENVKQTLLLLRELVQQNKKFTD